VLGVLVSAIDPGDHPVAGLAMTINGIWEQLLNAKERGSLESASFDRRGVPLFVDIDSPEMVDEEIRYRVRNFQVTAD
jgi:hypothetical protein